MGLFGKWLTDYVFPRCNPLQQDKIVRMFNTEVFVAYKLNVPNVLKLFLKG